ncbi:MAG: hypothetical protein ACTS6J_13295, partial [Burkholderiales bacterium]
MVEGGEWKGAKGAGRFLKRATASLGGRGGGRPELAQGGIGLIYAVLGVLVGFTTMPFSYWLNSYLDELSLPAALGGYTWATVGGTGMVAGFLTGK